MAKMDFDVCDGDTQFVAADDRPPAFDHARMRPEAWPPYFTGQVPLRVVNSTHRQILAPETLSQMPFLRDPALALA
jgi:hypothetical protein